MKKLLILAVLMVTAFILANICWADQGLIKATIKTQTVGKTKSAQQKSLEAIEVLTGFSWANPELKNNEDNYNLYPVFVAFDFNLKPLTKKWFNFNPRSLLQFQIEPFIGVISSPNTNFEMGNSFFLKVGILPQTSRFQPYIKAGVGMDYMTLHTDEQATQFNFISTGVVGMHYFFKDNVALTLEGSYRHLSNAGIDHPNHGINSITADAGILYQF